MLLLLVPTARAHPCTDFDDPVEIVQFDAGVEASGLAASVYRPGVFFTHGDGSDGTRLIAFDASGVIGEHDIQSAENHDWEDVASATCPDPVDGVCLYITDSGNTNPDPDVVEIYVVQEPAEGDDEIETVATWVASLPEPTNAEALLIHPLTGDVTLVTKDDPAVVYRLSADRTRFDEIGEADESTVTGGAWDPTGERMVLRTPHHVSVWETDPADPDEDDWGDEPEEQLEADFGGAGEGVTFTADGELYSLGPEVSSTLAHYPCRADEDEDEDENEDDEDDEDEDQPSLSRSAPRPNPGCAGRPNPIVFGAVPLLRRRSRRRGPHDGSFGEATKGG